MFNKVEYKKFRNDLPEGWDRKVTPPFNIYIPVDSDYLTTEHLKVLIVIEHVSRFDLKTGLLLGSKESSIPVKNVIREARSYAEENTGKELSEARYAVINFNFFKTYHLDETRYRNALHISAKRVLSFINLTKPNLVLVIGDNAALSLLPNIPNLIRKRGWVHTLRTKTHACNLVFAQSIEDTIFNKSEDSDSDESSSRLVDYANLLGYISRCFANGFAGKQIYSAKDVKPRYKYITNLTDFNRLMKKLNESKAIAVDIETKDLTVYKNQILTLQFAVNSDIAYLLPYLHKDTPFNSEELAYIRKKLRAFFSHKEVDYRGKDTRYLIGHGFTFDVRLLRQELGIPHIYWPIWDTLAGEFILDENLKTLGKYGTKYWGLANVLSNYGNDFYYTANFSKEDRTTIAKINLTKEVKQYCAMDAVAVYRIHELQYERSKKMSIGSIPYSRYYKRFLITQMSNIVHVMSTMEQRGTLLDKNQLMYLMESDSEINKLLDELHDKLYSMPSVQKANKLILKVEGVPSKGLFGKTKTWMFDPGKGWHRHILFIDVLKLEPIFESKNVMPAGYSEALGKDEDTYYIVKIDKIFQKTNKSVPEMALYSDIQKAKKIKTSYVNAFYKRLSRDVDAKTDFHIRPGYGYADVLTGRSNSFKPSLQQIPQHSHVAKIIKRLFIAPIGKLNVKMDYMAHEIRCLSLNTYIDTENGKIKLDDLLEMENPPKVYSFNHTNDTVELKEIGYKSKHTTDEDMYEIQYEDGSIQVTGNHEIWSKTRNTYVRVDSLLEGEELSINE